MYKTSLTKRDLGSHWIPQAAVQDQKVWGFTAKIQEEARHMDLDIIDMIDSMLGHVWHAILCTSLYLVFCSRITAHQIVTCCEFGRPLLVR